MHVRLFFGLLGLAACDAGIPALPSLFEGSMVVTASSETAVYDRPVIVRARVVPTFDGTGAFTLSYISARDSVTVESPRWSSLYRADPNGPTSFPVAFRAGEPITMEWAVRLYGTEYDAHVFDLAASADSVEVGGVLHPVGAEAVLDDYGPVSTSILPLPLTLRPQRPSTVSP